MNAKSLIHHLLLAACWAVGTGSCTATTGSQNEKLAGEWYIELEENDIGFARTTMRFETDGGTFEAFTRRGADKDILGGWTAMLGRTFTKGFKDGSLMRIERGIFTDDGDTLRLAAVLTSATGSYNIEGYILKGELLVRIRKGQVYKGSLKGYRKQCSLPMEDYTALFEKSVVLTADKIYNRQVLQTKAWRQFLTDMRRVAPRIQDDLEMVFAFFYYGGKLPLSHYAMMKVPQPEPPGTQSSGVQRVYLQEKSAQTVYMKVVSFDGTAAEMDSIFSVIRQKGYNNLIVDLRNNAGGSVEAGMAFATNLADSVFYGGIFLTQKYFNKNKAIPSVGEYNRFPHFTQSNYDLIIEGIHNTEGLCLKVMPSEKQFKGNVYVLTNGKTASTCEPIVYGLQQHKRAVIVGEKTAGAMLNGEQFHLEKGFTMVIPTADYYTADGYRIDQNGVTPNIEVKDNKALEYVMDNLIK